MQGVGGYYPICEPPALAPQASGSMYLYYSGQYKTALQSCPLNVGSAYLTIEKARISDGDYTVRIDLATKSKNGITNALTCPQQYTSTISSITGGWINLGRLQTSCITHHMKWKFYSLKGTYQMEALYRKIQCIIVIC